MSDSLVVNGIYTVTHEHDGAAIVRVLSVSDDGIMARVEIVDPLSSTFQLSAGAMMKVVIARCTFERVQ